jgi:hypothetical protein
VRENLMRKQSLGQTPGLVKIKPINLPFYQDRLGTSIVPRQARDKQATFGKVENRSASFDSQVLDLGLDLAWLRPASALPN